MVFDRWPFLARFFCVNLPATMGLYQSLGTTKILYIS